MNDRFNVKRSTDLILKLAGLTTFVLGTISFTQYVLDGRIFAFADFSAFYIAGQMALEGRAAESYDLQTYQDFYKEYFELEKSGYGWFYPPHFLLPLSMLAELPRLTAKFVWLSGTYAIYLYGMSKLIRRPIEWVFVVFLPAAIVNLYAAQTGFLITGLLALYLSHAESKKLSNKASAGLALALLTFKPHLWVTLPLLVLLRRQYIVLAACVFSLLALILASATLFGQDSWWAMFSSVIGGYGEIHDGNTALLNKMSTIAAAAVALGLAEIKLAVQLVFLVLSIVAIVWMEHKKKPTSNIITAFVVVSGFLVAPHNMVYDHTVLIIPCLLLMRPENEIPSWAIALCGTVYFFPYVLVFTDVLDYVPIGASLLFVFWACLLALMIRTSTGVVTLANDSLSSSRSAHPTAYLSLSVPEKPNQ